MLFRKRIMSNSIIILDETNNFLYNLVASIEKGMKIRTILIKFTTEIRQSEIPAFRGAINSVLEENHSILFHNHTDDGFRYSYPLIQYKRIGGKAAIMCVGEGTEAIGEFFNKSDVNIQIGDRTEQMEFDRIEAKQTLVQVWNEEFHYNIRKWLPLSSENYRSYRSLEGISEQVQFLQNILVGNILSFCKGLNLTVDKEIKCVITKILDTNSFTHKGVKMMGFDVEFKSNISLPNYLGLGKGVSLGFGMVTRKFEKNNDK